MGRIKRTFDHAFKFKVCESIDCGAKTVANVCKEYQLQRVTVERWFQLFLNGELEKKLGNREQELERELQKAQAKSRRTHDADRCFKKIGKSKTRAEKREFVSNHIVDFGSVQKACKAVQLAPSSYYYRKKSDPLEKMQRDADLRDLIEKIQLEFPQYGVRRVHMELKRHYGMDINRKRVQRTKTLSFHL